MTITNLSSLAPFNRYTAPYKLRLLLFICLAWLLNSFLSWLYLCESGMLCSPTRLVSNYISGVIFWYLAIPFAVHKVQRIKNTTGSLVHRFLLLSLPGILLIACNQLFVFKTVQLSYSVLWSYSDPHASWIREIITNNILLNLFFYCMIAHMAWVHSIIAVTEEAVIETPETKQAVPLPDYIMVKDGSIVHRVMLSTIKFVEVDQNCTHIHTDSRKFILYQSLLKFSTNLPPDMFARIHRSVIVNETKIKQVIHLSSGDATVVLDCGTVLKCSRHYKTRLRCETI